MAPAKYALSDDEYDAIVDIDLPHDDADSAPALAAPLAKRRKLSPPPPAAADDDAADDTKANVRPHATLSNTGAPAKPQPLKATESGKASGRVKKDGEGFEDVLRRLEEQREGGTGAGACAARSLPPFLRFAPFGEARAGRGQSGWLREMVRWPTCAPSVDAGVVSTWETDVRARPPGRQVADASFLPPSPADRPPLDPNLAVLVTAPPRESS